MAHVILFADRAPKSYINPDLGSGASYYNYPAGAYKIASVLRSLGFEVLVVSNCLSLTFKGVQQIIDNNSNNLLWVGISSTLMFLRSNKFEYYRNIWHTSNELTMDLDFFGGSGGSKDGRAFNDAIASTELVWSQGEINRLAEFTDRYNAPVLIGGTWVTYMQGGNFGKIHKNAQIVTNYAEKYVEEFTLKKLKDSNVSPPFLVPNDEYDFKNSVITYTKHDLLKPDNWLSLEVARGCGFNCAYCNFQHRNIRDNYKSPKVLREELIRNYEEYGITNYMLVDDLYNDSKYKVRDLYDNVWSKLPFKAEWVGYMRLDMFYADPESIEIVKESGARFGSFGIETLHKKAGAKVGKGLGKERILNTLELLHEKWGTDVLLVGNFIAGLPYEDKQSIQETMDWTIETDLLFSTLWTPLWVTPPEHFEIVTNDALTKLARDPEKWEIKWISPDNWVNSEGLTFKEVNEMCIKQRDRLSEDAKMIRGVFGFSDYADLRSLGMTHQDIVDRRYNKTDVSKLKNANQLSQSLIKDRLDYWLNVKL
jgi:hypothetical protein